MVTHTRESLEQPLTYQYQIPQGLETSMKRFLAGRAQLELQNLLLCHPLFVFVLEHSPIDSLSPYPPHRQLIFLFLPKKKFILVYSDFFFILQFLIFLHL